MRLRITVGALVGALVVIAALVLFPSPALACGISYQNGVPGPAGCSNSIPIAGAAVVGGVAVSVTAAVTFLALTRLNRLPAADFNQMVADVFPSGTIGVTPHLLTPLDATAQAEFANYRAGLAAQPELTRACTQAGPEYDYQRQHCGNDEFLITEAGQHDYEAWADGLNDELGLAQDSKFIRTDGKSWFRPETQSPKIYQLQRRGLDRRLMKYWSVITNPDNPIRGLEVLTNFPGAAQYFAERMIARGVPGIVRVVD